MILKAEFGIFDADGVTIHTVKARYTKVDGLPKRAVFALHRALSCDLKVQRYGKWNLAEVQSTRVVGTGNTPEEAIEHAKKRYRNSRLFNDYKEFRKAAKASRDLWLRERPEDELPFVEPEEQLSFFDSPMARRKLPCWGN